MDPYITLVDPWVDPPNTIRAKTVEQMYDIYIGHPLNMEYIIGKAPAAKDRTFPVLIRNKTLNCDISSKLNVPQFLVTDTEPSFIVPRNTTVKIVVTMNEEYIKKYTQSKDSDIISSIEISMVPYKILETVFVRTDLPVLMDNIT